MNPDDIGRLQHMLDAANEAIGFVQGRVAQDLTRDRILLLALDQPAHIGRRGRTDPPPRDQRVVIGTSPPRLPTSDRQRR